MVVVSAIRPPPVSLHQLQLKWWPHQKEAINNCNLCSLTGGAPGLRGNPGHSDSINTNTTLYSHALTSSSNPSYFGVSHRWASTNRHTFGGSPWSDQPCANDRMDDFHPRSNQLKPLSENFGRKPEKERGRRGVIGWGLVRARDLIKGKASWALSAIIRALVVGKEVN